eukprot:3440030-Alexandrium_andersonii.AAC.1
MGYFLALFREALWRLSGSSPELSDGCPEALWSSPTEALQIPLWATSQQALDYERERSNRATWGRCFEAP